MENLLLLLAFLFLIGFGYFLMCRLDTFLKNSGPLLDWEESVPPSRKAPRCDDTTKTLTGGR